MKIIDKLCILSSAFIVACLVTTSAFAASFNQEAGAVKYESGQWETSKAVQAAQGHAENLDDYDTTPIQNIADPLEPFNRFWFGFNDIFYMHIMRPSYIAYDFIVPDPVQTGLSNLFHNMLFPARFVNSLLQGKPLVAGIEFGRFVVNSTVGIGGLIDVAKRNKPIVPYDTSGEDFGQTLGLWGIGPGFYLVLPFWGPNSLRDTVGMAGDYALDPTLYMQTPVAFAMVAGGLRYNDLKHVLALYEDTRNSAVDPYVATREAYNAYRNIQIMR